MNIGLKVKKNIVLEMIKWFGSIFLLVIAIILNYVYCDYNIFIRSIIIFILVSIVFFVLSTTELGKFLVVVGKESYVEFQQVVWPTHQDTLNTTLVIIAVTMIISLILWGLDTVLVHVVEFGLRL